MQRLYTATSGRTLTPAEELKRHLIETKFNGDANAYWQAYATEAENLDAETEELAMNENEEEAFEIIPAPVGWMRKKDALPILRELHANSVKAEQERITNWNRQKTAEIFDNDDQNTVPPPPRFLKRRR